jgi:endonuclease III
LNDLGNYENLTAQQSITHRSRREIDCSAEASRYRTSMGKPRSPKGRAALVAERLAEQFPGTAKDLCELDHDTPFQLLAATILSAQTTDARVNMVTPELFRLYPTPDDLAAADQEQLEQLIHSTGFYRNKTKSLIGMATALRDRFGGEVPPGMDDLVTVPGTGRKTANVVRSVAMNLPGLPVDTHVLRLSKRLGLLSEDHGDDAVKVELALNKLVPPDQRGVCSLRVILHGRRVCEDLPVQPKQLSPQTVCRSRRAQCLVLRMMLLTLGRTTTTGRRETVDETTLHGRVTPPSSTRLPNSSYGPGGSSRASSCRMRRQQRMRVAMGRQATHRRVSSTPADVGRCLSICVCASAELSCECQSGVVAETIPNA